MARPVFLLLLACGLVRAIDVHHIANKDSVLDRLIKKDLVSTAEECHELCDRIAKEYWIIDLEMCNLFCRHIFQEDVERYNRDFCQHLHNEASAAFDFFTNLTQQNSILLQQTTADLAKFQSEQVPYFRKELERLEGLPFVDEDTMRQMKLITYSSADLSNTTSAQELASISGQLQQIYGRGRVCDDNNKCYVLPQLEQIFANSRNTSQLLWAWREWRNTVGPPIRKLYPRFVELLNEGARDNDFDDMGEFWRLSNYEVDNLEQIVEDMWQNIKPVYEELHAYVRRKLKEFYPDEGIQDDGPIPAHLLGNMWGQTWEKLFDIVAPYPNVSYPDVTQEMLSQNYTVKKVYKVAEDFFTSLGFDPLTDTFWEKSMFQQPTDGRRVQCHPLSFDMCKRDDFRIKMCTTVSSSDLTIVHHEMGHIGYFMQYQDQPTIYRYGANSGFHEAVGDVMALSANTPGHLRKIGLLKSTGDPALQQKRDINFLMQQALLKIAFIPFGLLIDKWRWNVFEGKIDTSNYNDMWWDLRLKYQGLKPPVDRSEADFDPASKFHIPYNIPYIRYFLSFQIQFQFHEALCMKARHKGALHNCDIYKSRRAGRHLRYMLKQGRRYHWSELMWRLTGQTEMDNSAMIRYFQPLLDWLKLENKGKKVGWTI